VIWSLKYLHMGSEICGLLGYYTASCGNYLPLGHCIFISILLILNNENDKFLKINSKLQQMFKL
jgi:hypothetical protein